MSKSLSAEEAKEIIEAAFDPLKCVCDISNHGTLLSFRVYATSGDSLLSVDELIGGQFKEARRLEAILAESRRSLVDRGIALRAREPQR